MLQSLTERVERLEAKAELFDKGLEVCVDAHKENLKDIQCYNESVKFFRKMIGAILIATGLRDKGDVMSKAFEQFEKGEDDLTKEARSWAGSDAVEAYKAGLERGADLFSDNSNGGQWLPLAEARKKLGICGCSSIEVFCKRYGVQRRVAAKSKGTIRKRWEVYLTPKKIEERLARGRNRRPSRPYMRSAQIWAKFYGVLMRDFTPALKRAGYVPGEDGRWRSVFLTPAQAKEIYEDIKSNATH